tara:strand:- start:2135 stop:2386 length:252 start_codon:yes stop_codon:yes gene_type:complete
MFVELDPCPETIKLLGLPILVSFAIDLSFISSKSTVLSSVYDFAAAKVVESPVFIASASCFCPATYAANSVFVKKPLVYSFCK